MKILQIYTNKKNRAQAMMEFALVIPVLLLLLYGVLETGRLLFIYSSTITAARQAVRYGSATGELILEDGTKVYYYNHCDGIRAAAKKVAFLNRFNDADILITYDGGLDSANGNPIALNPNPACGSLANPRNGDRIIVEVSTDWVPIVPIVPLEPFTITSTSERTILASVPIAVDGDPGDWIGPNTGVLTLGVTASTASLSSPYPWAGQPIVFTYTLTNSGGGTGVVTEPFSVTTTINGSAVTTACPGAPASLAAGASFTCSGTYSYLITQDDMDAGSLTSSSVGNSAVLTSVPVINDFTLTPDPGLFLSIVPNPAIASTVGKKITYTYTLKNTGNVSLFSPYSVTDNKNPIVNCSGLPAKLLPGAQTTCSTEEPNLYKITGTDLNTGSVVNQATAYATYKSLPYPSNIATAKVSTSPLKLEISASPETATLPYPNEVITYTYKVANDGASDLNSVNITFSKGAPASLDCPSTSIQDGNYIECTSTYIVTQADYDAGGTLINSATVTAIDNTSSVITSNPAEAVVTILQETILSVVASSSPSQPTPPAIEMPVDTEITFTYKLESKGNVTLSSLSVTDNKSNAPVVTCPSSSLAPGASMDCTGKYKVKLSDIEAGSIINTGKASYVFGAAPVDIPTSVIVITYSNARISLAVSASRAETIPANDTTTVGFTYTITNIGGKTLTSPSITSSIPTPNCLGAAPSLAPGASTTCVSSSYIASETFKNISTATAMNGVTPVTSASSLTVNICSQKTIIVNGTDTDKVSAWTIQNTVGLPLSLTAVGFNWDVVSTPNRSLDQVELPTGTAIYTSGPGNGKGTTSGIAKFEGPIYGPWNINIGSTLNVKMLFFKSGMAVNNLRLTFSASACGFEYTTIPYSAK